MATAWAKKVKEILVEKTDQPFIQLVRYGMVGTAAFLLDAGTLFLLTRITFFLDVYPVAVVISSSAALICTYLLSILWVFKKRTVTNARLEFVIFTLVGVIGILFNYLIVILCTEYVFVAVLSIEIKQARIMLSKALATIIVFFWNFIVRRLLLFRTARSGKERP